MKEVSIDIVMPTPAERAWHKSAERMIYSSEFDMAFDHSSGEEENIHIPVGFKLGDLKATRVVDYEEDGTPIVEQELIRMKRTGLKDKNGVEIYEGDVVVFESGYGRHVCEVEYEAPRFAFKRIPDGARLQSALYNGIEMFSPSNEQFEVVGNTWENP